MYLTCGSHFGQPTGTESSQKIFTRFSPVERLTKDCNYFCNISHENFASLLILTLVA